MTTSFNRRSLLLGSLGLAGAGLLTACGGDTTPTTPAPGSASGGSAAPAPATVDKINVGYIADGNGSTLAAAAEHLGLWEKYGLEPKLSTFTNGPLQIQALGTGDLDFGYIGPGALWLPMTGKAKIVALQSLGQADRVIAQPGITKFTDLKGKTVGVPEGTSGDMMLQLALEKNNMTVDDIKRTPMDASTVVSAFISGQIDAAGTWYPHVKTIKDRVPDLVELVKSSDFPELAFPACQVAGVGIADKAEILKKFQGVCKEAFTWAAANKAELIDLIVAHLKIDKAAIEAEHQFIETLAADDVIAKQKDGTVEKWFTTLNELFMKGGKVTEIVDPATYYMGTEYEQA